MGIKEMEETTVHSTRGLALPGTPETRAKEEKRGKEERRRRGEKGRAG